MLEKYKCFIGRFIRLAVICGILLFYQSQLSGKQASILAQEKEARLQQADARLESLTERLDTIMIKYAKAEEETGPEAQSGYQDGTYTGEGTGFGGAIQTEVVIKDGEITEINIASAEKEDSSYLEMAKGVVQNILEAQRTDVDTVTGATFSSKGILDSVKQALEEAKP